MKYFVFSDVHGDGDNLMRGLERAGYNPSNPNHQIISCGDNFGRAQSEKEGAMKSAEIYTYLTSSIHYNKPICIMGNHEDILLKIDKQNYLSSLDIRNGEHNTLASFINVSPLNIQVDHVNQLYAINEMRKKGFFDWIKGLPFYFETEHYIFTHGFIPMYSDNWREAGAEEWYDAMWTNTKSIMANYHNEEGKTFVLGHFGSFYFREKEDMIKIYNCKTVEELRKLNAFEPYYNKEKDVWFIDQTTALKQDVITILVLED